MYEVSVEALFSASHRLRLYDGELEPPHGHDWRVTATFRGDSLWWFTELYLHKMRPLEDALNGVNHPPVDVVSSRMGWLTWADLFKCTLRAALSTRA